MSRTFANVRPVATALALAFAATLLSTAASPQTATGQESDFLTRVRRLVFEGRRSGEGYFSPDGTKMVFQSERVADNPFYQIYEMDMTNGDTRRVSSGVGKTTCSFIRPGTGEVLFASTHHDPRSRELQQAELDFRASGEERRYAWDYDPEMELYLVRPDTGAEVRLTRARGYDAEASFSPDGQWIVFASTRSAFERELDPAQAKQLEVDPSYFAEIYTMKADGSGVRRLTEVAGYDGGPFFFPDGSRIIWRRFDESGLIADIWSMKPDGSDQRQLTDFGAMSWAPYVHPSGEYVFFASNKLGFANFEVFLVDVAGTKEPVRVTYTDGFDGLPVPTPDGERLLWTSSRSGDPGAQLYIGEWNHAHAQKAMAASLPRIANHKHSGSESPPGDR